MSGSSLLQPSFLKGLVTAWLWALALAAPLMAWLLSAAVSGKGPGSRFSRAAFAVGLGAMLDLGLVLAVRFGELVGAVPPGGPLGFLRSLGPLPSGAFFPADAVLLCALPHGAAIVVFSFAAALFGTRKVTPFRVPLADPLAALLSIAAVLAVVVGRAPYNVHAGDPVLLDFAAVLPLLCVALAVWTRAERPALAESPREPGTAATPVPLVDVVSLWRRIQALGSERPLALAPGIGPGAEGSSDRAAPEAAAAWADAGALGPPPRALEDVARSLALGDEEGFLVGDLPDPTERLFLVSCLLLSIRRFGRSALVVCNAPGDLRDALAAALAHAGAWSCGPLVAGDKEMREMFARGLLPAAIFLDVRELSEHGLRALCGPREEPAALFLRGAGLVLLPQVDRGAPLSLTHRLFTLRRLGLRLRAGGARFSLLASGFGGAGTRSLLEQAFPGVALREVPLEPRANAMVRAHAVNESFRLDPRGAWPRRALEPVLTHGLSVSVGDPGGAFDARASASGVRFVRDVAFDGHASASALDEAWLVAAYRALPNRVPLPGGAPHDALWALPHNPVTRFLTREGNLGGLSATGQLPPPRPVFGAMNPVLARAHLSAALHEGEQDLASLAGVFSRSLLDAVIGAGFRPERHALRRGPGGGELTRVALAPRPQGSFENPLRGTVTGQVVRIVDVNGGRLLEEVDREVVETRYYPGRVFPQGEERYEVPVNAFDAKRAEIRVRPVPADRPLTRPQLSSGFETATLVESPQEVATGRLVYRLATFESRVSETVTGFRQKDVAEAQRVTYGPVRSVFPTRVRGLFFPLGGAMSAYFHLARSFDSVLVAHLLAGEDDIDVVAVDGRFCPGQPAGIVVIDRNVHGMGVAEALDLAVAGEVLKWVRAILSGCKCPHGCGECTPQEVLDLGPDKSGVLRLLGA